jgi:hypothetical protein
MFCVRSFLYLTFLLVRITYQYSPVRNKWQYTVSTHWNTSKISDKTEFLISKERKYVVVQLCKYITW